MWRFSHCPRAPRDGFLQPTAIEARPGHRVHHEMKDDVSRREAHGPLVVLDRCLRFPYEDVDDGAHKPGAREIGIETDGAIDQCDSLLKLTANLGKRISCNT